MRGNRCVPGCSSQVFPIFVRDVLTLAILIALCQAKVDYVDVVMGLCCSTDQKVVWFDVSVNNSLLMHFLNPTDHLDCDQEHSLEV